MHCILRRGTRAPAHTRYLAITFSSFYILKMLMTVQLAEPVHQISLDCSDCVEAAGYEADDTARCFMSTGFYEAPYHLNQNGYEWLRLEQGVVRFACHSCTCAS